MPPILEDNPKPGGSTDPGSPNPKGFSALGDSTGNPLIRSLSQTLRLVVTLVNDGTTSLPDVAFRLWTESDGKLVFALRAPLLPYSSTSPPFTYADVTSGSSRTSITVKRGWDTYSMDPGGIACIAIDATPQSTGTFTLKAAITSQGTDVTVYSTSIQIVS